VPVLWIFSASASGNAAAVRGPEDAGSGTCKTHEGLRESCHGPGAKRSSLCLVTHRL
jgi:hypothetical protein